MSQENLFVVLTLYFNSVVVVDCGGLMDPENGAVTVTNITFNSTATYSCNDGYILVGDTTRTCLASGLWSGTAPLCTGIDLSIIATTKGLKFFICSG